MAPLARRNLSKGLTPEFNPLSGSRPKAQISLGKEFKGSKAASEFGFQGCPGTGSRRFKPATGSFARGNPPSFPAGIANGLSFRCNWFKAKDNRGKSKRISRALFQVHSGCPVFVAGPFSGDNAGAADLVARQAWLPDRRAGPPGPRAGGGSTGDRAGTRPDAAPLPLY